MRKVTNFGVQTLANMIAPLDNYITKTVAQDGASIQEVQNYDFENFTKALEWIKQKGARQGLTFGVKLVLGDGDFTWNESEILSKGLVHNRDAYDYSFTVLEHVNIHITGNGKSNTSINIEASKRYLYLLNSILNVKNAKINGGTHDNGFIILYSIGSILNGANSNLSKITLWCTNNNSIILDTNTNISPVNYNGIGILVSSGSHAELSCMSDTTTVLSISNASASFYSSNNIKPYVNEVNVVDKNGGVYIDKSSTNPITPLENNSDTAGRPLNPRLGQPHYDTDLGLPIWCKTQKTDTEDAVWQDATGAEV